MLAMLAWLGSSLALECGNRRLRSGWRAGGAITASILASLLLGGIALFLSFEPQLAAGVEPQASAYGAIVWTQLAYQTFHTVALLVLAAFVLARLAAKLLDLRRRAAWDSLRLLWHYGAAQGALIVALWIRTRIFDDGRKLSRTWGHRCLEPANLTAAMRLMAALALGALIGYHRERVQGCRSAPAPFLCRWALH